MSRTATVVAVVCAALALAGCSVAGVTVFQSVGGAYNAVANTAILALLGTVVYQYKLLRKPPPAGLEATVDEALRARIRASRECYTILDAGLHPVWQEHGARFPLPWLLADVVGRDIRERIPAGDEGDEARDAYALSAAGVVPAPYVVEERAPDGAAVWLETEHTPCADGSVVVRYRDVTDARASYDRLKRRALKAERERDALMRLSSDDALALYKKHAAVAEPPHAEVAASA